VQQWDEKKLPEIPPEILTNTFKKKVILEGFQALKFQYYSKYYPIIR